MILSPDSLSKFVIIKSVLVYKSALTLRAARARHRLHERRRNSDPARPNLLQQLDGQAWETNRLERRRLSNKDWPAHDQGELAGAAVLLTSRLAASATPADSPSGAIQKSSPRRWSGSLPPARPSSRSELRGRRSRSSQRGASASSRMHRAQLDKHENA